MMWTETAIARKLDGHFYQLRQQSYGEFAVVDLNQPVKDQDEPDHVQLVPQGQTARPKPDGSLWLGDICRIVCDVFGVSKLELESIRRDKKLVAARHVFFWLAKRYTSHSFPLIGSWCGRDHTTVMHGVNKVEHRMGDYIAKIELCLSRLGVSLNNQEAA